jgi:hypothetical protein
LQLREQALIETGLAAEIYLLESQFAQTVRDELSQRRHHVHSSFDHLSQPFQKQKGKRKAATTLIKKCLARTFTFLLLSFYFLTILR